MTVNGFPQALKIFKRRSAKDISIASRLFLFIGGWIWLIYGFLLPSFPILISNIFGISAETLVIVGFYKYG